MMWGNSPLWCGKLGDGGDGERVKVLADIWEAVNETELRQTCDQGLEGVGQLQSSRPALQWGFTSSSKAPFPKGCKMCKMITIGWMMGDSRRAVMEADRLWSFPSWLPGDDEQLDWCALISFVNIRFKFCDYYEYLEDYLAPRECMWVSGDLLINGLEITFNKLNTQ